MRIVTLLENTSSRDGLPCEHGLSLYIEAGNRRILFDAGQTDLFAHNAQALGIDLRTVDLAILSHGHYDHSGGMLCFLEKNTSAPLYASPYVFEPHFNVHGKNIGTNSELGQHDRLIPVRQPTALCENMTLYPSSCLRYPFPVETWGLETARNGIRRAEDFRHEQYLLITYGNKRILFSGCSHKGILNIVHHFRPDILIGGFHLSKQKNPEQLTQIALQLARYPTVYCTGHCTGEFQYAHMKQILGPRLHKLSSGTELTVSENGDIIYS